MLLNVDSRKRLMMDVDGCLQLAFPDVVTLPLQLKRWRLLSLTQHNLLSMAWHSPFAAVAQSI